jgi:hypothetical protein
MVRLDDATRSLLAGSTLVALLWASPLVTGCADDAGSSNDGAGASSADGGQGAGSNQGAASPGGMGGAGGTGAGSVGGAGGSGQGAEGPGGSGQGGSGDPYAAARIACINKINELRATKGAPPYAQWTQAESCADGQATSDEQTSSPHGAFGQCGEAGQNECLGGGVAGIESCLESMWAEKDQPGCAGCDACAGSFNPSCPNCDFYGDQTGDVCGHYVNMRALYFNQAACGFSSLGGWALIDFQ